MRHIPTSSGVEELIVEINGYDVRDDLLAKTGFDINSFSYLGFLF